MSKEIEVGDIIRLHTCALRLSPAIAVVLGITNEGIFIYCEEFAFIRHNGFIRNSDIFRLEVVSLAEDAVLAETDYSISKGSLMYDCDGNVCMVVAALKGTVFLEKDRRFN